MYLMSLLETFIFVVYALHWAGSPTIYRLSLCISWVPDILAEVLFPKNTGSWGKQIALRFVQARSYQTSVTLS